MVQKSKNVIAFPNHGVALMIRPVRVVGFRIAQTFLSAHKRVISFPFRIFTYPISLLD